MSRNFKELKTKTKKSDILLPTGDGYITTDTLKEILRELDNRLTEEELDGIIEEVDEDGSGTLDFDGEEGKEVQRKEKGMKKLKNGKLDIFFSINVCLFIS